MEFPLCIIECKRPDIKDSLSQAVSQHLRNQQEDGIRLLYVYVQTTLSISTNDACYATTGTPEKFWAHWEEKFNSPEEEKEIQRCLLKSTGQRLVDLLQSKSDAVVTTIINKFETAVKKLPKVLESPNIFVLVDEGYRT